MTQKGEHFVHVFKHYMLMLLESIDAGSFANVEISVACQDLLYALNPETKSEEPKRPFRAVEMPSGRYMIRHISGRSIGKWETAGSAEAARNWLNIRYDK